MPLFRSGEARQELQSAADIASIYVTSNAPLSFVAEPRGFVANPVVGVTAGSPLGEALYKVLSAASTEIKYRRSAQAVEDKI